MSLNTTHYDFIIAGGGLAGLSLACHLARTPLCGRSILIVDQDPKRQNDRTWGFWADKPTLFDGVVSHTWDQLLVAGPESAPHTARLQTYRYKVIRGIDIYADARRQLQDRPNVTFLQGTIEAIEDGRDAARICVDGKELTGAWIFDSLPPRFERDAPFQVLKMHFHGWEVLTPSASFDPETVTFMDFRTPQEGEMRFFYVLPYAADRALVEFTVFSQRVLPRQAYEDALRQYLASVLQVTDYAIDAEESGAVPITDNPLERSLGRRVMAIGARAGRIKPSTGYAYVRIQKDCEKIIDSLLLYGHPFNVTDDPDLYDVMDAVLLKVIAQQGDFLSTAFESLFAHNTMDEILRFLDEVASPREVLELISAMPPQAFIKAAVEVMRTENLLDIIKG